MPKLIPMLKQPVHWTKLRTISRSAIGRVRTRSRFLRENPVIQGFHEIINQPIYDDSSVAVATAFPTQTLHFQVPAGQSSKTLWDTSMRLNGILQAPQKFLIRAFRCFVRQDASFIDIINFLTNNWFNFVINQKPYFYGPAYLWSAGAGVQGYVTSVGAAEAGQQTPSYVSNGVPDQRSIFALSRPIQIEQNENFYLELNNGSTFTTATSTALPIVGSGLRWWVILDGELSRAVQ